MTFYFTATGNCRFVADQLAEKLGDEVRSIPQEMRRAGELSYADEAIGIVHPIYGHMMPHMVREFVERAKFDMNEQRAIEPQKHIGENLARIGEDVAARRRWIKPVSDADCEAHAQFMDRGIAFEPADLGNFLRIDPQACTG